MQLKKKKINNKSLLHNYKLTIIIMDVNKSIYLLKSLCIKLHLITFAPYKIATQNAFAFQHNVVTLPLHNAHWVTLFNLKK